VILVTGAGKVGRNVVSSLHGSGAPVRVLTRHPALAEIPGGVEVVGGDLSHADTLGSYLDDVDAVFLIWPQSTATHPLAAVEVITRHVRRVAYLSSSTVRDDLEEQTHPMTAIHADIERAIERSGADWTFLRVGKIATNTLFWSGQIAEGIVRLPFPDAGRSPIVESDIGEVAARTLLDEGHVGAKHVLSGPEPLTEGDLVRIIGEAIGRPIRVEQISPEVARAEFVRSGESPEVADAALALWERLVTEPERVTPTVEEITGSPGRTFREWAVEHASAFR
jgi:uncharacterized protein YbjT (DUF2867 family)